MNRWKSGILIVAFALALPFLLVALNVRPLLSDAFVAYEYSKTGFPQSTRFTKEERQSISRPVIAYLQGRAPLTEVKRARDSSGNPAFSKREIAHLVDVRGVFDRVFAAGRIALAVIAATLFARILLSAPVQRLRDVATLVSWGSSLTLVFFAAMVAASVAAFDRLFMAFHRIFFPPGSFLFQINDTLIQLYPERFWIDATVILAATTVVEALVLAVIGGLTAVVVRRGIDGSRRPKQAG